MFVELVLACLKVQFHQLPGEPEENDGRVKPDLVPGVVTISHETLEPHNYKKDCSCV